MRKILFAVLIASVLFLSACSDERSRAQEPDERFKEKYQQQAQENYDSQVQVEESQDENNSQPQEDNQQPQEDEKSVAEVESQDVPVISLPFSIQDWPDSMVPMGETVFHPDPPNPGGHPGIDFQWQSGTEVRLLASMDGIVSDIKKSHYEGSFIFSIRNGNYGVDCDVTDVNPEIKVGQQIKRGDYIGHPQGHGSAEAKKKEPDFRMTHWQFGYVYDEGGMNRLCPTNYWDNESRVLIEKLWGEVPNNDMVKKDFPEICSGYYKGRDE